jgi:hypothetical protein
MIPRARVRVFVGTSVHAWTHVPGLCRLRFMHTRRVNGVPPPPPLPLVNNIDYKEDLPWFNMDDIKWRPLPWSLMPPPNRTLRPPCPALKEVAAQPPSTAQSARPVCDDTHTRLLPVVFRGGFLLQCLLQYLLQHLLQSGGRAVGPPTYRFHRVSPSRPNRRLDDSQPPSWCR